jgi:hypothetical protein
MRLKSPQILSTAVEILNKKDTIENRTSEFLSLAILGIGFVSRLFKEEPMNYVTNSAH